MNRFLILITASLLFNCIYAVGQNTYYISSDGNDSFAGTKGKPWKTLQKLANVKLRNNDKVLLKRGDTFTGPLLIQANNIIVDAYGQGAKPVISGEQNVQGNWRLVKDNVWEITSSGKKLAEINALYKNNISQSLSRYPNADVNNGYLNFESSEGISRFTDKELNEKINWTGAEVVIRAELFRLVRTDVSRHSGNSIEILPNKAIARFRDGFGYFFVNDIRAIDQEGEWAYDKKSGKLYVYSTMDPNKDTYSIPATDTLISISNAKNVQLNNLKISVSGKLGVSVNRSSGVELNGLEVTRSAGDGIIFNAAENSTLRNSVIADANWSGVFSTRSSNNIVFDNNVVRNIGNAAYGKSKTFIGIDCNSSESKIINNRVINTGYAGVICCGQNNLVKRNVIDSVCRILEDMGGIYTNNNINNTTGTIIEENIVTNSSCVQGGGFSQHNLSNGIYLDNRSQGVTVRNNTVAFVDGSGIFVHSTLQNNKIYDNTSYQSGYSEFYITNPDTVPRYDVKRNLLVANNPGEHIVLQIGKTAKYSFEEIGVFQDNHIVDPFYSGIIKVNYRDGVSTQLKRFSVEDWEKAAGPFAKGNKVSAVKYKPGEARDAIVFLYNTEKNKRQFSLPKGRYVDVNKTEYSGKVSVDPYRSLVLFKMI